MPKKRHRRGIFGWLNNLSVEIVGGILVAIISGTMGVAWFTGSLATLLAVPIGALALITAPLTFPAWLVLLVVMCLMAFVRGSVSRLVASIPDVEVIPSRVRIGGVCFTMGKHPDSGVSGPLCGACLAPMALADIFSPPSVRCMNTGCPSAAYLKYEDRIRFEQAVQAAIGGQWNRAIDQRKQPRLDPTKEQAIPVPS